MGLFLCFQIHAFFWQDTEGDFRHLFRGLLFPVIDPVFNHGDTAKDDIASVVIILFFLRRCKRLTPTQQIIIVNHISNPFIAGAVTIVKGQDLGLHVIFCQ